LILLIDSTSQAVFCLDVVVERSAHTSVIKL
jgi:hypothetical protein